MSHHAAARGKQRNPPSPSHVDPPAAQPPATATHRRPNRSPHPPQGHLKLHEVKFGPQPYAHVKASMVRLPYACSLGRDSLLQTLVESDVPVKVRRAAIDVKGVECCGA